MRSQTLLVVPVAAVCGFVLLGSARSADKETRMTSTLVQSHTAQADAIRPFRVNVPEATLVDLRRRIAATRWPAKETVTDRSQGVQLARLQSLVQYWGTQYDWRKVEARLNTLPQFMTTIDGLDIHFIHVRSKNANPMPLLVVHGWPGSVLELVKTIGPLTDPTAFGGRAEDAFDVVIPSMPGYGFSSQPTTTGWGPDRMGRAFDVLMKRIGYDRYVAQGGDWGAVIVDAMGVQAPKGLLAIHVNMPATVPPEIATALQSGAPAPAGLTENEKRAYASMNALYTRGGAYAGIMVTRPQTIGYSLSDSPVGLAAFFYDKFNDWTYSGGDAEKVLTRDEILDDITLYWVTNTGASSSQLYWENNNNNFNAVNQKTGQIKIPVGVTVFPGEIYQAPKSWTERAYPNLSYFNEVDKGGHFAAWEQPELFSVEVRAAFRSVRSGERATR